MFKAGLLAAGLASSAIAQTSAPVATSVTIATGPLKDCAWRPAEEKGPPGRSALFCPNRHNGWRRVISDGLSPQTEAQAQAGDVHAMAVFGWALIRLQRGQWDAGKAYLQKAADRGDALALEGMGLVAVTEAMRTEGSKVAVPAVDAGRSAAVRYYRLAAEKGNAAAMRTLWYELRLVRATEPEAKSWLRKAAEAGDVEAMLELAWQLTDREGKTGDPAEARKWLTRAAESGDVKALNILSNAVQTGVYGFSADAAEAKAWRAKAEAAHVEKLLDDAKRDGLDLEPSIFGRRGPGSALGDIYFNGDGVARNVPEAMRWYVQAAEHGDEDAAFRLETIYSDGASGVAPDPSAAARWKARNNDMRVEDLIAGAEDGEVGQMKQLATLYFLGHNDNNSLTAPKNPVEGMRWLKAAQKADPNDAEIPMMLAAVAKAGLAGQIDPAEANRLAAEAAAKDPVQFGPVDDLIAHADKQETFALIILAKRLFEAGRRDEGVFWYYVGQLRGRMEASANETTAQAYGALFASLGPMFNEYAAGDLKKLDATIDKVLAWDEAHPLKGVTKDVRQQQRKGLVDLKAYLIANKDKVRAERSKNGLPNTN